MKYSDHRILMAKLDINWYKKTAKKIKTTKVNRDRFRHTDIRDEYKQATEKKLEGIELVESEQEQWDKIVKACHEASEEVLGHEEKRENQRIGNDEEIKKLSREQKELRMNINAAKTKEERQMMQRKRNDKLREIHNMIKQKEEKRLIKNIEDIENSKDDSNRMYKAIRNINRQKPKESLLVEKENGTTSNEEEVVEIITDFFRKTFNQENQTPILNIKPTEMKVPFTEEEVDKAIKSLKNEKSAGTDEITAEQLKYGSNRISKGIAMILNNISKSGNFPKEIKAGILVPLPKPGKKKGPTSNLRPIILLSMIRKILAICMIRRIHRKIREHIPVSQAAYSAGRSTTELVFSAKILAEKAITSSSYETNFLLLDMSKAFDTVDRGVLYEDLEKVLEKDELHMITILLKDVTLTVRNGKTMGTNFTTNIGVPQGDCLSPVLFTLYLANAMKSEQHEDHTYAKTTELQDHSYATATREHSVVIDQQYADDIGWMANKQECVQKIKETVPRKLRKRNLQVNEAKTEEYQVKKRGPEQWKKCKYLGSLLGTEEDIKRRKQLAMAAFIQHKHTLTSTKISLKIRTRIFNAYVTSIFLYNSEIWTLSKKMETQIDTFQRNILRKMLNIKWPHKISNEELYTRTNEKEWSAKIRLRRLKWLGHLMRLPEESPARLALQEALEKDKKPQGRPTLTWISMINKELRNINKYMYMGSRLLKEATNDRKGWNRLIVG
jgi:hypothetical protein